MIGRAKATGKDGLPGGGIGMGAWNIGDRADLRTAEIESLRLGIALGLTVIDTAEMYGGGRSEKLVGEAIADLRDRVRLVSKVLPSNASFSGVRRACEASLGRLRVDRIDLYLLHWRGGVPLAETVRGMEALVADGLIGAWGVSNFDVDDMAELEAILPGYGGQGHGGTGHGGRCAANQILYSLDYRGVEYDLLRRNADRGVLTMAYSPLGQGGELLRHPALAAVAARHETSLGPATPAQVALAFVLRHDNVLAIPKAGSPAHQRENVASLEIALTARDLEALDLAFPPPRRPERLAML